MLQRTGLSCAVVMAGVAVSCVPGPDVQARGASHSSDSAGGIAVVELFTSQGCSSCPPAERVLGDLSSAAATDHRSVFTLAFHVDYWNSLGWADPFSSSVYSARQQWYGQVLGLDQIYTPQMIVNGQKQFVGSDRASADRAIADALGVPATMPVTLTVRPGKEGVQVRAVSPNVSVDAIENIAVVEQGLSTEVERGENAGRRLDQPSVVRWFKSQPAAADAQIDIPKLPTVQSGKATVIVYLQRSAHDATVTGAASTPLP